MAGLGIIGQHLRLSLSLFASFGAMLSALWAAGALGNQVLLRLAVEIGMLNRLLGLFALAPVILLQLVVFVAMFVILRRGMGARGIAFVPADSRTSVPAGETAGLMSAPAARGAGGGADGGAARGSTAPPAPAATAPRPSAARPEGDSPTRPGAPPPARQGLAGLLLVALVPFYGYYAGWGLLGDTLRSYSQVFYTTQMARTDFTKPDPVPTALQIGQTGWVILAVLAIWAVRRAAKAAQGRAPSGIWPLIVVACEATWALLGLYVISGWKTALAGWLATLPAPGEVLGWLIPAAGAAALPVLADAQAVPVDWPQPQALWPWLTRLFWYAMLPLVWFNLGAIVYGHDPHRVDIRTRRVAGTALDRWQALPKPLTDFIGHFWAGLVKRWHAVANGVLLAASAGVALTVSVLVLWRLVAWLGGWAWIGAAQLIGPQDMATWQLLSVALNALFNAPGAPPGGLLVAPLQFCILAAGLELAHRAMRAEAD